jgi:hypothetical protein
VTDTESVALPSIMAFHLVLAFGVCGDVFIVVYKLRDRLDFCSSAGVIMLLAFAAMRFGYS